MTTLGRHPQRTEMSFAVRSIHNPSPILAAAASGSRRARPAVVVAVRWPARPHAAPNVPRRPLAPPKSERCHPLALAMPCAVVVCREKSHERRFRRATDPAVRERPRRGARLVGRRHGLWRRAADRRSERISGAGERRTAEAGRRRRALRVRLRRTLVVAVFLASSSHAVAVPRKGILIKRLRVNSSSRLWPAKSGQFRSWMGRGIRLQVVAGEGRSRPLGEDVWNRAAGCGVYGERQRPAKSGEVRLGRKCELELQVVASEERGRPLGEEA